MANKSTIAELFDKVKAFLEENGADELLIHFIEERKELHVGKLTNHKPTEKQIANEKIGNDILDYLAENGRATIGQMIANVESCNGLSTSKVSSIVTLLKKSNKVKRTEEKNVAYFEIMGD